MRSDKNRTTLNRTRLVCKIDVESLLFTVKDQEPVKNHSVIFPILPIKRRRPNVKISIASCIYNKKTVRNRIVVMEFDRNGQRKYSEKILCKYMTIQNENQSDFVAAFGSADDSIFSVSPTVSISTDTARFR